MAGLYVQTELKIDWPKSCVVLEGVFSEREIEYIRERLMYDAAGISLRILVADDNRDAADSLAVLLRLWGHEVRVVYDGVAALLVARHFLPDVALLDFQMPRMNGGTVARMLRIPGHVRITVIATTGTALEDIRLAGYDGAFDAYLAKPYNLDRLEKLVADCQHSPLHLTYSAQEE